jgi:hypothetical protein
MDRLKVYKISKLCGFISLVVIWEVHIQNAMVNPSGKLPKRSSPYGNPHRVEILNISCVFKMGQDVLCPVCHRECDFIFSVHNDTWAAWHYEK